MLCRLSSLVGTLALWLFSRWLFFWQGIAIMVPRQRYRSWRVRRVSIVTPCVVLSGLACVALLSSPHARIARHCYMFGWDNAKDRPTRLDTCVTFRHTDRRSTLAAHNRSESTASTRRCAVREPELHCRWLGRGGGRHKESVARGFESKLALALSQGSIIPRAGRASHGWRAAVGPPSMIQTTAQLRTCQCAAVAAVAMVPLRSMVSCPA